LGTANLDAKQLGNFERDRDWFYDILVKSYNYQPMSDPNFPEQTGDFAIDAAIDTIADNLTNKTIEAVSAYIPGGETVEPMLETEVDQVVNNEINSVVNQEGEALMDKAQNFFG
jgi:hypothetical protein